MGYDGARCQGRGQCNVPHRYRSHCHFALNVFNWRSIGKIVPIACIPSSLMPLNDTSKYLIRLFRCMNAAKAHAPSSNKLILRKFTLVIPAISSFRERLYSSVCKGSSAPSGRTCYCVAVTHWIQHCWLYNAFIISLFTLLCCAHPDCGALLD